MSDDRFGGGDLITGLLFGMLLAGGPRRRPTSHTHGDHWHEHLMPAGYHVHDGHPDGPIRVVPASPEQLAAAQKRRARNRGIWAAVLAVVALFVVRVPWLALTLALTAIALSATAQAHLKEVGRNVVKLLSETLTDAPRPERRLPPTGRPGEHPGYVDPGQWDVVLELVGKPHVRQESRGRVTVLARIVNRGRPLVSAYLTATMLDGLQVVGTASGWVDGLDLGRIRTVHLHSPVPPPPFDDIVVQIDQVVTPSRDQDRG